ncbi:MAG: DUF1524 domain-containing protein, partial [Phycisphaerae bacterium]|nr:DUF1524 domain-containing protein [Phycisphaerae bacterium]
TTRKEPFSLHKSSSTPIPQIYGMVVYLFWFLKAKEANKKNSEHIEAFSNSDNVSGDPSELSHWVKVRDLFGMTQAEKRVLRKKVCESLNLQDDAEGLVEANLARLDETLTKESNILKTSTIDEDLPSVSPQRKTESDILEIFVRINRQGTPLNRSDLIFSMLKLNWKESAEALPDFVEKINKGNSFELDTDFVIRCLYAVSDLGTKFDVDVLRNKTNMAIIKANFFGCCKAIESTVDFIQQHCWCSNMKSLSGANTLVPFVYYLFCLPNFQVPNKEIVSLRKAIYIFGFTGPFSRYGDSRVAKFIKEELKPLKASEDKTFPFKNTIWWARYWNGILDFDDRLLQGNPRLALQVLQRQAGGKAKFTQNSNEIDHIFPRAVLRTKSYDEAEINHFANYWLLSKGKNQNKSKKHPKRYFEDVLDSELKRALINRQMLDYRKYKSFIKLRGEEIKGSVMKTLGFTDEDFVFE